MVKDDRLEAVEIRRAPPVSEERTLGSLLPCTPDSNQAAQGSRQSHNAIIQICISQSSTWNSEVAQIRNQLEIRRVPFPLRVSFDRVHLELSDL